MYRSPAHPRSHRTRTRRRVAAAAASFAAAAAIAGAGAAAAGGAQTSTRWYSIDQQPATASSPAQFLTATSTGQVKLDRYQSGEWRQQWTPVYPEWPESPTVTGTSAINEVLSDLGECVIKLGCPFSVRAVGSPHKYVNRMYAMCLTFQPVGSVITRVLVSRCGGTQPAAKRQLFSTVLPDTTAKAPVLSRSYTKVYGTRTDAQGVCLDSAGGSGQPGTNAAALDCQSMPTGTQQWSQQFRFLQSSVASCRRYYPGTLCGLGAPVH